MTRNLYPTFDQPALADIGPEALASAAPSMLRALAGLLDALDHGEPAIGEAHAFARRVWDELTAPAEPDCAARLPQHLAGRLDDLRAILDRDDPEEGDDERPGLSEYGLGSSFGYSVRVDLSTGGPADYVTATIQDGEARDVRYHFADWYDHAERQLDGDERETVERWLGSLFDLDSIAEYVR